MMPQNLIGNESNIERWFISITFCEPNTLLIANGQLLRQGSFFSSLSNNTLPSPDPRYLRKAASLCISPQISNNAPKILTTRPIGLIIGSVLSFFTFSFSLAGG